MYGRQPRSSGLVAATIAVTSVLVAEAAGLLTGQSSRAVAEIALQLQRQHGWVVTYEDPRYEHHSDLEDVTEKVSRAKSPARRILVPRTRSYAFEYSTDGVAGSPRAILSRLLDEDRSISGCCVFRLESDGTSFHIIPAMVRGRDGQMQPATSPLDAVVKLQSGRQSTLQLLNVLVEELKKVTGFEIGLNVPFRLLDDTHLDFRGGDAVARNVLKDLLMATGRRASWRLLYDPGLKVYGLNVTMLAEASN